LHSFLVPSFVGAVAYRMTADKTTQVRNMDAPTSSPIAKLKSLKKVNV